MALAVAEPAGEAGYAVAVDDAVGDEAHRAPDDVRAAIPLGRSRGCVRHAALARTKTRSLRGCGLSEEQHSSPAWPAATGSSAGNRCRSR